MTRALGAFLLLVGVLLVIFGVGIAFGDPYDSGRAVDVVVGVLCAALGAGIGALGWPLVRRR
jgi:drug/metabolite transporter (DMT)-like permease